jgi:hypothetical protein
MIKVKSRWMRWVEHVICMGEVRNAYKILVRKPGQKIPLGKPRYRQGNNIKIVLKEIGHSGQVVIAYFTQK